ncbi:hypothetical protein U5B43_08335 [Campylobacter sp. 9BO]|uniref:hypothetical protein n=1 Tax=Campylobacter sp. 9BO TaxID=3424759 RepID=UPI003D3566EC
MREICFCDYLNLNFEASKEILTIRNLPYVREASKNTDEIRLDSHINWIKNLQHNQYFAIIVDSKIIGSISLIDEEWGIFYKDDIHAILKLLCVYVFFEKVFQQANNIHARVKISNQNALNFNLIFGFKETKNDGVFYYLTLNKEEFLNLNSKTINLLKKLKVSYNIKWF